LRTMQVTRSLAAPTGATTAPPTAEERRDEEAETGRFEADGGPTDWRRVAGRPIESLLPSRPTRVDDAARSGVAAVRAVTGRAPVRCDGIACALLESNDEVAGDLGSASPRSRDAAVCACLAPACGEAKRPLAVLAGEPGPPPPQRICPFLASNARRAPLPGVEAPPACEGVRGLLRKTVSRTTAHLLGSCRPVAGLFGCVPGSAAAAVRKLGSLASGRPQGLLRPWVARVYPHGGRGLHALRLLSLGFKRILIRIFANWPCSARTSRAENEVEVD